MAAPQDRNMARFLVEHELDAYTLGRVAWYNVAVDGQSLRKRGHAVNRLDPFDVVRLGWADHLPHSGVLHADVLPLPPEHMLKGLRVRPSEPNDGPGSPDSLSPLSSPR